MVLVRLVLSLWGDRVPFLLQGKLWWGRELICCRSPPWPQGLRWVGDTGRHGRAATSPRMQASSQVAAWPLLAQS